MIKEQHEKLVKYEQIFRTAIDSNYYRAMDSRFATDFISMCHELHIHIKPNCPACVLNALKTMGKLYFAYKEPEQRETPLAENLSNTKEPIEEPKEPVEEKPIQDTQKPKDIEIITKTNKVSQKSQKQQKKKK